MKPEPSHPDHLAKALGSGQQFLDHAAKDIGETVIPVVVTKDCGIASFIKKGQNGVLIDWHENPRRTGSEIMLSAYPFLPIIN